MQVGVSFLDFGVDVKTS